MTTKVPIELSVKGGSAAEKAFSKLNNEVKQTSKAIGDSIKQSQGLKRELKDIDRVLDKVETAAIKKLDEQIDSTRKTTEKATKAVKELRQEAAKPVRVSGGGASNLSVAEQRRRAAFDASDPVGDVDTGVAAFAGAFGQFGGAGLEQATRGLSDVLAISEAAPRVVASLATISPAMLATTAGLGAASLAFYAMNKALDASEKAARKNIEAMERQLEAERQTREDLRSLSIEDAQQRIADLRLEVSTTRGVRAELDRLRDESRGGSGIDVANSFTEVKDRLVEDISGLGETFGINIGALGEYNKAMGEQNTKLTEQKAELERLIAVEQRLAAQRAGEQAANAFTASLQLQLDREMAVIQATNTLTSDAAKERLAALEIERQGQEAIYSRIKERTDQAWQEISDAIDSGASQTEIDRLTAEASALQEDLNLIGQSMGSTNRQIDDFNNLILPAIERRERENQRLERFANLQDRAHEAADRAAAAHEKAINAQQALADFEGTQATEALNKRREASINAVYDAQLNAIDADIERAKASEKVQQAQQKAAELNVTTNEKIRDTNAKFMEQELGRLAEFRKAEARINDDFAREQRRRLEDLNDELSEASTENDVVAFIQAQKEGSKELARAAEDFNVDASRRVEDFNAETQRNHADHTRQLYEIDRQYQEQRLQLQQAAGGQELSLLDQLQAKRAEILANRERSLEQLRQSIEQQVINNRRQSLIQNMNAMQQEYNALNTMATRAAFAVGRNTMISFLQSLGATAQEARQQARTTVPNSNPRSPRQITQFGEGGAATEPTFSMLGERPGWGDVVFPFRKSEGIESALSRLGAGSTGGGNHFDFTGANFGGMNRQEIEASIVSGVTQAIRQVRASA